MNFRLVLWLLPAVALLTGLGNALAIGAGAAATAGGTQMVVRAVAHWRPDWTAPVQVLTAGGLLTLVDLLLRGILPGVAQSLGVGVPLLLLTTVIALLRVPAPAGGYGVVGSRGPAARNWRTRTGFLILMVLIGGVRQLLGVLPPESFRDPAWLSLLPPSSYVIGAAVITLFMLFGGPEHRIPQEKPKAAARGCCRPPGEG